MSYLINLNKEMKSKNSQHTTVNVITFIEDCPTSVFPIWYKYEGSVYMQESQQYKDKPVIEKVKNFIYFRVGSSMTIYFVI